MSGLSQMIHARSATSSWPSQLRKSLRYSVSSLVALVLLLPAAAGSPRAAEAYSDDFVGEVLRPEWRVENEDAKRYGIVEGNYLLLVSNDTNKNVVVKSIDGSGNFSIELIGNGTFSLSNANMAEWKKQACIFVGVRFAKDDRINISACTERTNLSKTVNGEWNGFIHLHDRFSRFLLRLEKNGVQYKGTAILDGNEIELGSHFMPQTPTAVFIGARNADKSVPEAGILIDRISITPH